MVEGGVGKSGNVENWMRNKLPKHGIQTVNRTMAMVVEGKGEHALQQLYSNMDYHEYPSPIPTAEQPKVLLAAHLGSRKTVPGEGLSIVNYVGTNYCAGLRLDYSNMTMCKSYIKT